MEENGFFVTLPSNSSADVYPNNKISCYVTKLAKPIELEGPWEVALSEVQYPHTWYMLKDKEMGLFFIDYTNNEDEKKISTHAGHVGQNYYNTMEQLVKDINKYIKNVLALDVKLEYNLLSSKIRMVTNKNYTFRTYGNLARILGLGNNNLTCAEPEACYPADIHAGFYNMFVYTDIIQYQRVGDSFVPLLRCVHISGKQHEIVSITYDHPHYVPVNKSLISDIVIEVKSDQNRLIPFLYGKFVVKLHFRPAKHYFRA